MARLVGTEFKVRKAAVNAAWTNVGPVSGVLLGMLAFVSLPAGALHGYWVQFWKARNSGYRETAIIESWTCTSLILLLVALNLIELVPIVVVQLFALLVLLRLVDLFYVLLFLLIGNHPPKNAARAVTLLLVHYIEVVLIFGCAYLILQRLDAHRVFFLVNSQPGCLTAGESFYFSLMTAATVGFGDITPVLTEPVLRSIVILEPLCLLFMTAIEIPRLLNFLPPPPVQ